jgi:hypothetical protein
MRSALYNSDMTLRVGFCVLVFCSLCLAQIKRIDHRWVFVSQPLSWNSPPPEIENRTKWASAGLIVLYPSGDFGEVRCTLYRSSDGHMSVSRGDSHIVRVGTWSSRGKAISIKARVVYTDGLPIGKPVPGPELIITMTRAVRGNGWHLAGS